MRASVQVRSSTEVANSTGYKIPAPNKGTPVFRVVRWHATDPGPESIELLWEGKNPNEYSSPTGLPQWSPFTGYITEFQERKKGIWQPCCDPRLKYARPPVSGPHTQVVVIDSKRGIWDTYWNFFESEANTFIVALNTDEARNSFATMPLGLRDIVIFASGDSTTKLMVRSLRTEGYRGHIFVSEEKPRWRSRLSQAGCTAFFTKTDMWALIQMVYRVQNV